MRSILLIVTLLLASLAQLVTAAIEIDLGQVYQEPKQSIHHVDLKLSRSKIKMYMDNTTRIDFTIFVNETAFNPDRLALIDEIQIQFEPRTLSPQFDILELRDAANDLLAKPIHLSFNELKKSDYIFNSSLYLKATYIGHATIQVKSRAIYKDRSVEDLRMTKIQDALEITIIRHEGILDKIFMYSVIIFITVSYINLGAQIDTENVKRLVDTPRIVFLGFLIGVVVMPTASWIFGHLYFRDQPMYRIGSFIYACGPAASASVLWTVMFDSDKELSLALQIASTVGALLTMPIFLYAMDKSIDLEGRYTIKVPYMNLARTLIVLLIALMIGSRLVGSSKRAKRISQRIFRPLTMFVLLFIIVFSSIVYWYIYRMFDWTITLMALIVTSCTYIFSGLLGYIIHRDIDQMITISISSTYRNSGIAFAALVVAFQPPDTFIAYVPCLTQVVSTSLIGLVLYSLKSLRQCYVKKEEAVALED